MGIDPKIDLTSTCSCENTKKDIIMSQLHLVIFTEHNFGQNLGTYYAYNAVRFNSFVGQPPKPTKAMKICFVCKDRGKPKLFTCAKCRSVPYCGPECQAKHWPKHRK